MTDKGRRRADRERGRRLARRATGGAAAVGAGLATVFALGLASETTVSPPSTAAAAGSSSTGDPGAVVDGSPQHLQAPQSAPEGTSESDEARSPSSRNRAGSTTSSAGGTSSGRSAQSQRAPAATTGGS